MNMLLRILSWLYGAVTWMRNALFDSGIFHAYKSSLPVISVGNLTAGGNGKTPLVILLAEELRKKGYSPVVLARGYGGTHRGPLLVGAEHGPQDVGDEPLLIAQKASVPVVVARRRSAGARFIEAKKVGNLIILDDGFQHRWLARDLDIVSVYCGSAESREAFLAGQLLPAGRFREFRDRAFQRIHLCVFASRDSGSRDSFDALYRVVPAGVQLYRSYVEPEGVFSLVDHSALSPCPVVAVCGIANPEGFLRTLEASGFSVLGSYYFSDHHIFTEPDIRHIRNRHPGIPIVCTEKDALRIPGAARTGIFALRIVTKVSPGDAFITGISRVLLQRQQRSQKSIVALDDAGEEKRLRK